MITTMASPRRSMMQMINCIFAKQKRSMGYRLVLAEMSVGAIARQTSDYCISAGKDIVG